MLLLNYRTKIWTKIMQDKTSRAGWTEKKSRALLTQTKKNWSGQFFCQDNFLVRTIFLSGQFFCPDIFFVWPIFFFQTTFLSGQFFCPDNFYVWTNFFVRTIFLSGQKGIYHQVEFSLVSKHMYTWQKRQGWWSVVWDGKNWWFCDMLTCSFVHFYFYVNIH